MDIQDIKQLYAKAPGTVALCKLLQENRGSNIFLQGQQASATPLLFAAVATEIKQTFLFVLQDADEAGYFYHDLTQVMGTQNVLFFPSSFKRSVKYGQRDSANEILRTEVLARVSARENQATESLLIISYPEALSELVVSKQHLDERRLSLKTGQQQIDITDISYKLREYGFQEVDYVYEPGQYSVRGSILDVYSFSCENPFRIDFFGREIDTIRTFEVQDQLSKDKLNEIEIVPELATLTTERVSFLNFLPSNSVMVYKDFAYIRDVIAHVYDEGYSKQAITEQLEGATEIEQKQIIDELNKEKTLLSPSQFAQQAATFRTIEFGIHAGKTSSSALQKETKYDIIKFKITPQPLFHKNFDLLVDSLDNYILQGYKLYILADSDKQNQRLKDIFADMDSQKAKSIVFEPVNKTLHEGFADDGLKCCFFTDHQIFDRYHKYNLKSDGARAGKMALTMKELQEMEPGDFIVHVDFGIGKFGGLVRVPAGNSYQEMIRIIYQHNDKVDVSIHSLYKISKYRRSDTGEPPRLSTLGTGAWDRLKEKTKKRIKDIARDLIKLYAQRRHERGHAFSGDSYLQHELEASFLYEDTPDQSKATQDVKADMESQRPMDRLVCGDVGFGKTEVAVRAAFKSACDSKQVAVLVPTTVLAYQHYQTFKNRLKGMPVRVDYLSRARTAKQTKQVLTDLEDGKIDILIGTHKLLGKAVKWHDLGLLIIDEEQKFGVSTKEKLRKLKTNVDTLTMSATPIPRTLQFSLMGARDMSIIRTPPPNRYPIHTELATFSHEVIADAINFEMSRNGQVYFVHDRINGLQEIANLIHKYVPDCRIAIGHGQMPPEELEKVLMGFMNYDYDVLLSTTIVENGIDISNANTMIINDAHRFGLSDLHQMRGRVGRSNRKAFCYLLAPPKSSLTPEARRRLEALENFSELGSGFNLAMQDLDIRGAGNLLGAEQSGFMEDLGYETYQKILNQAVTELKNDEFQDIYAEQMAQGNDISGEEFVEDCAIESDLEMYFPDNYVPGSSERMLLYRELDNINDDNDLEAYRQRLIDRFGEIPHEGLELMQVVPLRRLGKRLGCEKISLKQGKMNMQFVANPESAYYQSRTFSAVINYVGNHPRRCDFKQVGTRRLLTISEIPTVETAVSVLREMLKASTDATQA
ncbi:transcription-repair coupling factor [Prevotella salivae]|uniref:Transcription-repair-coupling factor n=1 Tax=Segatella salivae TaxID=228604 RepID=A0AAW4NJJ2_9BACT|nr:transcription-repair coupling factor [Segatella salivae]MBW4865001.1 transcription-repair coupling factor [Segatella salivae]MBW4909005.1 transcription-repair coupling factor [Segatella salivae]